MTNTSSEEREDILNDDQARPKFLRDSRDYFHEQVPLVAASGIGVAC
jgi:hypothetical protein